MSETPRRRGRPPKPDALTPAERMKRTRGKAVAVLEETAKAADLSDSALLELVRIAYRDSLSEVLAEAVTELFARMPKPYPVRLRPSFEQVLSATVAGKGGVLEAEIQGGDAATVTRKAGTQSVTVTENAGATVTKKTASKSERDERVLALKAEGLSNRAIARELGIAEGTVRNVLRRTDGT